MVTSPPDHPATGKCSKVQMDFIRKIKTQIKNSSQASIPYLFEPPPILETGQKPKAEPYYIKPLLVFVPHLQCPAIFKRLKCSFDCCSEVGSLKAKEWQSNPTARYVHDILGSFYFMTYLYTCEKCSHDKQSFQKLYRDMPNVLKSRFNIQISARSAYSDQFISYICTSAASTSTLHDTVKSIGSIRATRYFEKRWQYESAVASYKSNPPVGVNNTDCTGFSSIDNPEGYNEMLHIDFQTVVDIFCDFVEQQKPIIQQIQKNILVPFCVSMDTTKRIRKKTTTFTPGRQLRHIRSVENGMSFILGCKYTHE